METQELHRGRLIDHVQLAVQDLTASHAFYAAIWACLHVPMGGTGGRLSGYRIRAALPAWQSASIWFCGPPGFGQALREDFVAHGLLSERFHQELFEMR